MQITQIGRIVLDIETAPIEDAAQYMPEIVVPKTHSKPESIAKYIAEAKAEWIDKCATDLDLLRIVAVGCWIEGDTVPTSMVASDEGGEKELLDLLWATISERIIVGFATWGFDVPALFRRSVYLNVKAPDNISLHKYQHPRIIDFQQTLTDGPKKGRGLDFYRRRLGLPDTGDTITGADIPGCVARGEWDKVRAHCESDVRTTAALAHRLIGFRNGSDQSET